MRDLVIEDAKRADWERYVFNERPDWALDALQRRDPEQAARLFAELAAGPDPGLATVAARLLLEKANIRTVWKNGDDLRVLVERTGSSGVWQRVSLATLYLTGLADEPVACPVLAAKAALHPKFSIYLDHFFRYP